ncbi:MAG: succinate--CoA ligase subunit alpha [Vulcanimicrobiaceae bacterium]
MIVRATDRVLVVGITGKQASFWTERMIACGTRIVGGSNPAKAGTRHLGLPVYASARSACAEHPIDVAVLFTPPAATRDAVLDALAAGIRTIVVLAEHVPVHDVMWIVAEARERGARIVGPNTAGLVTPGEASVGIMPGFAQNIFRPGNVGVVSRSGSLGTLVALNVVRAGLGQSAFIGIGGDPIVGTTTLDAVRALAADPATEAIVIVGELGGGMEEAAAAELPTLGKPVVAFIAGATAPPGRRMGHAGAIVDGTHGSGDGKVRALRDGGALVIDSPSELGDALRSVMGRAALPAAPH